MPCVLPDSIHEVPADGFKSTLVVVPEVPKAAAELENEHPDTAEVPTLVGWLPTLAVPTVDTRAVIAILRFPGVRLEFCLRLFPLVSCSDTCVRLNPVWNTLKKMAPRISRYALPVVSPV